MSFLRIVSGQALGGKALGFEPETLNRFSHLFAEGDFPHTMELTEQLRRSGVEKVHHGRPRAVSLYHRIYGLPCHLGQHSGGMIICQGMLDTIGALNGLAEHRREAQWKVEVIRDPDDLFSELETEEELPLSVMNAVERLQVDYAGTGLTTGAHPMKLIREQLPEIWRSADLASERNGVHVRIAGQVICRQRPGTAKGFVFVSLEDETGVANTIVTPRLFERCRLLISEEPFLLIEGVMQNSENVIHVKAQRVSALKFRELALPESHDFR